MLSERLADYAPVLALLLLPVAVAFTFELLWVKDHALRRLRAFRPSVRRDVGYWALYVTGAAALLELLTPVGALQHVLAWHIEPLVPVGDLLQSQGYPVAATLLALIVHDFGHYWAHRLCHQWPWLWKFHAVHHTAEEMCILTGARISLTEHAVNGVLVLSLAGLLGLSVANVLVVLYIRRLIDTLQHSSLAWTYGRLGYVFASPVNHYYHHSVHGEDRNSNYGNILALWDHLFATANPQMVSINRTSSHHERPKIGLASGAEPWHTGFCSLPVVQDWLIWKSLLCGTRKDSSAGPVSDNGVNA